MVGCVIVRNRRIIARGWHRRFGEPHAEVEALRSAHESVQGATAYVSLEPCSHVGKTPPCVDALIQAGIARVVAAMIDPFPQVAGGGLVRLRDAGVQVQQGLLADEARDLNAAYLTRLLGHRPYVIAKWAQSLDGKTATRKGDSQWISGQESRRLVHRWRARVDAIAVGINTVLADDPRLTARDVLIRRQAARVIFDSQLRIATNCTLLTDTKSAPVIVATTSNTVKRHPRRADRIRKRGAEVLACRRRGSSVSVVDLLVRLADRGMTNLLVEGGATLLGSFMDRGVVDEIHVFTAPILIGGEAAPSALGGTGVPSIAKAVRCETFSRKRLGDDWLVSARLTEPPCVQST